MPAALYLSMNSLRLMFEEDDDHTGELFAEVSANGFSGHGSAWFDCANLLSLIERLNEYPIPKDNFPVIKGGFWDSSTGDVKLKQEHLHLSFYPIESRGQIGVRVRLSQEEWPDTRKDSVHKVDVEFNSSYEELSKFASRFRQLIEGKTTEVVLNESKI